MSKKVIWLTIGKIVSAQGLRGEVRVNPSSDFPERFITPGDRWIQTKNETPKKIKLTKGRKIPGKNIYVVSFEGTSDRRKAELLIGNKILVNSIDRPNLKKGEFHLLDLVGLSIRISIDGPEIGKVTNLNHAGNDLLEVKLSTGKIVLIPFVKEIVPEININEGWLIISPPPGLLEL